MGAPEEIRAVPSQLISNVASLTYSSDNRREQVLQNAGTTAQGVYESTEAYKERMEEFRRNLAKKFRKENTTTAEKRFRDIQNLNLFNTNDPLALRQGQSEIESLLRFTYFNNTNPLDLTGIKAQQTAVEARLASLKKGLEPENNTTNKGSSTLYNGEWQGIQRDFLS